MLLNSNTCLAPFSAWSCKMASSRCCSSTLVERCRRASRTASFRMLLAFSLRTSSEVVMGIPSSSSRTRLSSSVLTDSGLTLSRWNTLRMGPSLLRISPKSRCSGPTLRLASRVASSREKARISDTLDENWLVTICTILLFTFYEIANIVPTITLSCISRLWPLLPCASRCPARSVSCSVPSCSSSAPVLCPYR